MRKLTILLIFVMTIKVMAHEDKLRITLNEGNPVEINATDIQDISFVEDETPLDIVGEWFCEAESLGVYESFEFHDDGFVNYFYYYINYHSGGTLTGTYSFEDYLLKIKLPSIALQKFPIIDHSDTHYTVLSAGSRFNYYKVQKTYYMTTDDLISIGNEGDVITYVDNQFIGLEDDRIKPKKAGTGYALVRDVQLNTIVAYKVIVENSNKIKVTDWTEYFLRDKTEIVNEFGTPTEIREDNQLQVTSYVYEEYSPSVYRLMFNFDNATEKVRHVSVNLRTESYFEKYHNDIKSKYVYHEDLSTPTELVYYDTDDKYTASLMINVFYDSQYNTFLITYTDLR